MYKCYNICAIVYADTESCLKVTPWAVEFNYGQMVALHSFGKSATATVNI